MAKDAGRRYQHADELIVDLHATINRLKSAKGATLYTTFSPCLICTKMIINAGVIEVVYSLEYPLAEVATGLLEQAGIGLRNVRID